MIPAKFEYAVPETIEEAIALLKEHGEEAKVLTGGHSLIPLMRLRLARPGLVVDLRKVPDLSGICVNGGEVVIGAATTHAEIAASPDVPRMIAETAQQIGDPQVRNAGTIGGSLVHADPAADWPAAMLAARATIVLRGPGGARSVAAETFFRGILESAAAPGEILTSIRIPASDAAGAYEKVAQSASGFALAGVAAQLVLARGAIGSAQIGITGVAEHAYRPAAVEKALAGCAIDAAAVGAACAAAADGVELLEDIHASARYRAHLARVLAKRAVLRAAGRARAS